MDRLRSIVFLLIALAAALAPIAPALADSWVAPRRTTYFSANRAFRLIVTPHIPADRSRRPFVTEPDGRSAPGSARALLQRRDERGRWRTQWQGQLRNEVMPVSALVANSGRYFVTFDDWGGRGTGLNVVVIYDGAGRTIRALSLVDLLSEDYARALPHSFSSIFWGSGVGFSTDGERLLVEIAIPSEQMFDDGGVVPLEVVLATGRPVPLDGPGWDRALAETVRIRAAQRAREAQRLAYMTDPLLGPVGGNRGMWEQYLTEAYYRLYPGPVHPTGWALERPGAPRYADSRGFVATILRRSRLSPDVAVLLGSPDEEDLIRFLADTLGQIRPGAWRGSNLYVTAHDANWPRIAALIVPTGATPIQIDPTEPIPQLPARLRRYVETGASGPLTPGESTQD
jgi:hypothetical protein